MSKIQPFKLLVAFEMKAIFGSNAAKMSKFLLETSLWGIWYLRSGRLTGKLPKLHAFVY